MFAQTSHILSPSGATLCVYYEPAQGATRGIIQINHGLAEHGARYARFAKFLSAKGFHVYAHDHRGHGNTKVQDVSLGSFAKGESWQLVLDDTLFVRETARANHPIFPLIVFGHSLGGVIALNSLIRDPQNVTGGAIWNANFSAGLLGRVGQGILSVERMLLGSDVPSIMLPKLTFQDWAKKETDGRTAFDWLSRDATEVDLYVNDPLCGWDASVGMWQDIFRMIFQGADDRNFAGLHKSIALHLRGGGHDPATDFSKATKALSDRLGQMGFSNVSTVIGPDNRHECLNDINRDEVMVEFGEWVEKVAP